MLTSLVSSQSCIQHLDLGSVEVGNIQLQISHQLYNKSFRQVVSVIVAMEKLRNSAYTHVFRDDDLRNVLSFIFEEGT